MGVLHRDLKPENVLFESFDNLNSLKVADFGISRLIGDTEPGFHQTQTGFVVGTPFYAAPEQMTADCPIDTRADIYSIGVMLYEMLAGQLPRGRLRRHRTTAKYRRVPTPSFSAVWIVIRIVATPTSLRFARAPRCCVWCSTPPSNAQVSGSHCNCGSDHRVRLATSIQSRHHRSGTSAAQSARIACAGVPLACRQKHDHDSAHACETDAHIPTTGGNAPREASSARIATTSPAAIIREAACRERTSAKRCLAPLAPACEYTTRETGTVPSDQGRRLH